MTERSPGSRYADRTKQRARSLYRDRGWSKARIARHLDVGLGAVSRWLADPDTAQGGTNPRLYDRAAMLADAEHMSRAELRAKHGASLRFISDLLSGKLKP